MSYMSEERKEALRKKYSKAQANTDGKPAGGPPMGPGRGHRGKQGPGLGGKPKNVSGVIRRLFNYIGKDKIKIVFVYISVLGSALTSLGGTYILRPVINNLVDENTTSEDKVRNLLIGILLMAAIYFIGVLCSYLQQRIMIGVSQKALVKIREELFAKLQKLPLKYHDTHTHGELMSRFTNDLDAVGEMLNNTLAQIFSGAITLIGTLILMFVTNWILTVITLITTPALIYVAGMIGKRSRKYYIGQQQALGAVNGYIEEMITGQKVVKVFCHEEMSKEEFNFLSDELRSQQIKAQFFGGIMGPVMGNLSQISYAITGTIGGILFLTSNFDLGGLTIFTNYARHFSRPVNELSMQVNTIFAALAGAERVFEILDAEPERSDADNAIEICSLENRESNLKALQGKNKNDTNDKNDYMDNVMDDIGMRTIKGEVVLKNVTFGYVPGKTILKNINVIAKSGQKIAFVGSTGAGKTTITNLINRFYEIDDGKILIDGIDIKNIKKDSLQRNIAMVLQDTHLFSGTVMENIRYGRLDATDEEVITAAKTASAHSFIERLSEGYNTVLEGDGANLSQGQRQLLNIARAAISKAPILILDEATSSVDTRTEKHIEKGMDRLMKNRTTFVIAHRLSTVRNADQIIVLEQGEIVEQGNHDELLEMEGRYYQLYTGAIELD